MTSIVYVTTSEITVGCTFSSTEVIVSNLQGPQGPSGVVSVVSPITFNQLTGEIGINATSSDTASYVVQRDSNQRFSIGAIDWDRFSTQSSAEARLYWDGNQSLNLGLGGGNVTIALGQEVINYVTNAEATTLNVGEVVYLFGAQGDRPSVKRASNTSDTTSSKTFGIVAEAITAGGAGFVIKQGIVSKVNTAAYAEGDILWLSATPGQFTKVKPVAPNHLVFVGVVLRTNAGNGLVYVSPQNGYELDEIHNVLLTSESDGQYLVYQASNDLWVNKSITATTPVNYAAAIGVITIDDASVSAKGAVRLSSSTDSTSEVLAATPKAVKTAYDLANTANTTANAAVPKTTTITTSSPLTGGGDLSTNRTFAINDATTAQKGAVQLSSSVTSTSEILAATPNAVKTAYDAAVASVQPTRTISTTAPLAGGGDLSANRTFSLNTGSSLTVTGTNLVVDSTIVPYLANANTFTASPQQITGSASAKGLIIRMNATTPGNPLEIQNSSSTVLANFDSLGNLFAPSLRSTTASTATLTTNGDTGGLLIGTVATGNKGLVINGVASQTANIFEVQLAGVATTFINSSGRYYSAARFSLNDSTFTAYHTIQNGSAASVASVIRAGANQAVDLQQLQNSATSVLGGANALAQTYTGSTTPILVATGGATTAASGTGTTATITTTSAHGLATGDLVTIAGVTPTGYNGTYLVTATPSSTQISYANTTTGSQTVAGTVSAPAQSSITARSAGTVGQVVRAAASQVANLQEWQNSSGSWRRLVDANGNMASRGQATSFSSSGLFPANNTLYVEALAAGVVPLITRGFASQTANLQEWQNSSATVLVRVDSAGNLNVGTGTGGGTNTNGISVAGKDIELMTLMEAF